MKLQPKLLRLLTPPPLTPTNLQGDNLQEVALNALSLHMTKSVPASAPRTAPFKLQMTTLHPSQPLVAYILIPDERDKKTMSKSIVVQHIKTRAVVWSMSLGDIINTLSDHDTFSETFAEKQYKIIKRLDFSDPSTLYWSGHTTATGQKDAGHRWSHLFVQLTNCILIVDLRRNSVSLSKSSSSQPVASYVTQELLGGSMISSNAMPVSQHKFIVGMTDGSLKIYNWKTNTIVVSFKLLTNKNDSIVHICSANKYGTPEHYSTAVRKIVCLSKKGAAYLMELQGTDNVVHGISPPIYKFEGGSVPSSMSKQDDDHSSMEHILLHYCAYRDLLLWSAPSRNKEKLMVWNLSNLPEPDNRLQKRFEPKKVDPVLVTQFPYDNISHTIYSGWFHESLPMECIGSAAVTKEGDFQVLLSPLYGSASSMKKPFEAATVLSVNLGQIIQRDMQMPMKKEVIIKVHSVSCPPLRDTCTFYFGTNIGIVMVRMVDGNLIPVPGSLHAHLSANYGSLGKSILSARNHNILYGSLEPPGGSNVVNPIGAMECRNNIVVYESPPPLHLPPEIHKRPVRLPPLFLPSPSRNYLCCFWKEEMRYEVLHVPTMLDRVSSRGQPTQTPLVASGDGVSSFAWIGNNDVFSLLYHPEQDLALKVGIDLSAPQQTLGKELANAAYKVTDVKKLREMKMLKEMVSLHAVTGAGKSVVTTAGKLQSLKGLQEIGTGTGKAALKLGKGSVNITKKIGLGTAKVTTKIAVGTVQGTTKLALGTGKLVVATGNTGVKMAVGGVVQSFGRFKKKLEKEDKSLASEFEAPDVDETVKTNSSIGTTPDVKDLNNDAGVSTVKTDRQFPWVELRALEETTRVDGSFTASASNLGELSLRTGKRNPPTILFGGPVLCAGSKYNENDEGLAYFYTLKKGEKGDSSASFVSSGPAFPCPDIVVWDDDGCLCAVVIKSRVSIYLSDEPNFVMLGTARLGSSADADVQVTSARFIHGTLYCTTRSSVQCVFLGDLDGGVCHLDVFTLASSEVSTPPSKSIASDWKALTPPIIPMPLSHPTILGYQNGSLMVSTVAGVQAIPLGFPLLRIGSLIAAGHAQRAELWFDAVLEDDHEALATFIERRGVPELALRLSGLSLETIVDMCMRYGFTDQLEQIVERYGLKGLRAVDMSRGLSSNIFGPEDYGASVAVCVGAYLLSEGRVELVRRMATECLTLGDEGGKREGFILASLLLSVQGSDSKRVIARSVENVQSQEEWPVGYFVRNHILNE